MSRQRKRPTVMPARASYGTAREGTHTSERPIGRTPKLGAEPRVATTRLLTALDTRGQRRHGDRPDHQHRPPAFFAEHRLLTCTAPVARLPLLAQLRPPTRQPESRNPALPSADRVR